MGLFVLINRIVEIRMLYFVLVQNLMQKKISHHCSTRPLKNLPNSIRQVISHCDYEKKSART